MKEEQIQYRGTDNSKVFEPDFVLYEMLLREQMGRPLTQIEEEFTSWMYHLEEELSYRSMDERDDSEDEISDS